MHEHATTNNKLAPRKIAQTDLKHITAVLMSCYGLLLRTVEQKPFTTIVQICSFQEISIKTSETKEIKNSLKIHEIEELNFEGKMIS